MRRHSACWQAAHVADAFTALGVPRHDPGLVRASSYPRGTDDHVLLAFRMPQGLPREVGDSKIPEENLILTSNGHARRRFSKILFWVIKFSCHLYNYDNFSWKSDFINIYLNVWNCFFFHLYMTLNVNSSEIWLIYSSVFFIRSVHKIGSKITRYVFEKFRWTLSETDRFWGYFLFKRWLVCLSLVPTYPVR